MSELTGSDPAMASTPESAAKTTEQTTCTSTMTFKKLEDLNTALLSQRITDMPQTQGPDFAKTLEAILTLEPGIRTSELDCDMIHPEVLATMQSVFKKEVETHMLELSADSLESATGSAPEAIAKQLAVLTRDRALFSMDNSNPTCSPPTTIIRSCAQEPEELRFFEHEAHEYHSPMERQQRIHTTDLGLITQQMISFATNMFSQAGPSHRPSVRFEKIYSLQPYQTDGLTGEMYRLAHNMGVLGATLSSELSWQSECKRAMVTVNTETGVWIFIEYKGIHGDYYTWMDRPNDEVDKGWKVSPVFIYLRI